jgi:hypothetical protein
MAMADDDTASRRMRRQADQTAANNSGLALVKLGELGARLDRHLEEDERTWAEVRSFMKVAVDERAEIKRDVVENRSANAAAIAEIRDIVAPLKTWRTVKGKLKAAVGVLVLAVLGTLISGWIKDRYLPPPPTAVSARP